MNKCFGSIIRSCVSDSRTLLILCSNSRLYICVDKVFNIHIELNITPRFLTDRWLQIENPSKFKNFRAAECFLFVTTRHSFLSPFYYSISDMPTITHFAYQWMDNNMPYYYPSTDKFLYNIVRFFDLRLNRFRV
jgi:hypothetical protein